MDVFADPREEVVQLSIAAAILQERARLAELFLELERAEEPERAEVYSRFRRALGLD